jgi:primosomal protein N' (replication factor Y)
MKILTVMPFKKGVLKEEFTYFSAKEVENGSIVSIPMRNKKELGIVISSEDASDLKINIKELSYNLKKIEEVKEKSIFKKELLESYIQLSKYFVASKNLVISSLIPTVLIEEYDQISKISNKKTTQDQNKNQESNIIPKNAKPEKLLLQTSFADRISFYKTLIRSSFAEKKSIFIILPTEKDIEIFYENLSKGIEKFTFTIHGSLSKNKQLEKITETLSCEHPVLVLATAPYLAIPRNDFKNIILEREHSSAYKTIKKPNIDLRIFAEIYAFKSEAKFILADTILRFETIARKELENLSEVYPLTYRTNFDGIIKVSDKNERVEKITEQDIDKKKFKILTTDTINKIQKTLEKEGRVFIFSLRKGLATTTICNDCAEQINCEKCRGPLVLYQNQKNKNRVFLCNKCGTEKDPKITCPNCGSWNLVPLGIGTDTVYEEVKKIFPKTEIFKLDREAIKTAKKAEETAKNFYKKENSILVGTEMAVHYLKEKVPLAVIASFDSLWSIPNFRMSEKIVQIIISVLNKTEKELIIETKNQEDEIINAIKIDNLSGFIKQEIQDRKDLNYPPFKRFIKISFIGDKNQTASARKFLAENFKEYNPEIFSGFIAKLKDKFMTNVLIKMIPENWSIPELSHHSVIDEILSKKLMSLPQQFVVNIDPEDIN